MPLKRALVAGLLALSSAGPATLCASELAAREPAALPTQVGVRYVVTWLGLPVVRGRITATIEGRRYRATLSARTVGIAERLFRDRRQAVVEGVLTDAGPQPRRYRHTVRSRKENRTVTMTYLPDGKIVTRIDPKESPGKRKPVPARLQKHTLDPLSAMIAGTTLAAEKNRCGFGAPIFDGRRRLDIRLTYRGREASPVSFAGVPPRSVKCEARVKRIAGFRPRAIREHPVPPPIEVWSVRHDEAGLWIPVKLRVKAGLSTVVARITKVTVLRRQ